MSGHLTPLAQIARQALFARSKPAIVMADRIYTYGMIADGIDAVSCTLRDLALDRGRPVGLAVANPGRHLVVLLALWRSGFSFASLRQDILGAAIASGVDQVITDEALPPLPGMKIVPLEDAWFRRGARSAPASVDHADGQIIQIMFSSGSTGSPKAFGRTLAALHQRIHVRYATGEAARSRMLPMTGLSASGFNCVMRALMDGNTVFFAPHEHVLASVFAWRIDEVCASVGQAAELLRQRDALGYDVRLGALSLTAATLSIELEQDLRRAFGCEIIYTYAAVEGGAMAVARGDMWRLRERRGNCFAPLTEFRITGENGAPLRDGEEGRIWARHDHPSSIFEGDLFVHRSVAPDGWIRMSDVGRLDQDGLIVVTGRADEVINLGGAKINPEIIEDALRRYQSLSSFGVVRVQAPSGEHEAWLAVAGERAPTLEAVNHWLERNATSSLGGARLAKLVRVERVPLTDSGKVARAALRDLLLAKT